VSKPADEHVLVIPTHVLRSAGPFHGFSPDVERYLPLLRNPVHLGYLARSKAETDPSFKQLIPYIVLRCGEQVLHYTRGKAGSEARLRARRSIGVGGHICAEDGAGGSDPYRAGMLRELAEEVLLLTPWRESCIGLINDDRTPVGQVHLGIVHVLDLAEPRARCRESALVESGFAPLAELRGRREEFETWSQFLLDGGLGQAGWG
jgi:predicted NUDIX family phosphoesterase